MNTNFSRSTTDKYVAGVCGGLGASLRVDSNIVRVVMVLATLFMPGPGWLIYPALWLAMPTDDGGPAGYQQLKNAYDKSRITRR